MDEKKRIPQIRLFGFDGEWTTTRLGDVTVRVTRKNRNMESTLPLTISAQHGLVDQTDYFNSQIAGQDISGYYLLMNGEFAYNKSTSQDYPVGAVKRLDRYDMGVLSTLYILFKPTGGINSDYLATYFDSDHWHQEIKLRAAEGARNHGLLNISPDDFFDIDICVPEDAAEQQAIGTFLQTADLLISRKSSKLEKLRALKASMLEKMFPKDGADLPEVRFKEFTGAWERQPLAHYLEVSDEKNIQNRYPREDVLSVSGECGVVNQMKHLGRSYSGLVVSNYNVVHCGDVVYTKSPLRDAPYGIIKTNMGNPGIVSALYAVYHPKETVYSPFVQTYFESDRRLNDYLRPIISKGAKNTINVGDDTALLGTVSFPSPEEQKAIHRYFGHLGDLILLTMRQLEKLQSMKKAMLEKMFV